VGVPFCPLKNQRITQYPVMGKKAMTVYRIIFTGVVLASVFAVEPALGQKFGTLDSATFLEEVPEVRLANVDLEAMKARLVKEREDKIKRFETRFEKARKDSEGGKLSPVEEDTLARELDTEKREIDAFERDIQERLLKKREELLTPILAKVDKALKEVAEENGYQFIFDISAGGLLFVAEGTDVAPLVREKMGIED